jgi:hypothetical protein
MATIGNLFINVKARTTGLEKGLNRARNSIKRFTKRLFNLRNAILGLGVVLAGRAMFRFVDDIATSIDLLAKTSAKLGMTSAALQKLRFSGQLAGVGITTIDMALQRFVRRVAEAAMGTGEAKGALQELGVDAKQLSQMPVDQAMIQIADAMKNVKTDADKVRLAFKLFDSEGVSMINMLRNGGDALRAEGKDFENLQGVVSAFELVSAQAFKDSMLRMSVAWDAVKRAFAQSLFPVIETVANSITTWMADTSQGLRFKVLGAVESLALGVASIGDAWRLVGFGIIHARALFMDMMASLSRGIGETLDLIPRLAFLLLNVGKTLLESFGIFDMLPHKIKMAFWMFGEDAEGHPGAAEGAIRTALQKDTGFSDLVNRFKSDAKVFDMTANDFRDDLADMLGELPSEGVKRFFRGIRKAMGAEQGKGAGGMMDLSGADTGGISPLADIIAASAGRVAGKTSTIQTALGSATVGPTVNLLKQVVDELKKQTRMSKDMKRAAETPDYGYDTGNAFT